MTTRARLLRLILAASVPAAGMALSPAARANVRNTSTANVCQFEDPSVRGGFNPAFPNHGSNSIYRANLGMSHQLISSSTGQEIPAWIICNVSRNLPLSTDGLSDLEIRFRSLSAFTPPREITCTAYSFRTDQTVISSATRTVSIEGTFNDGTGIRSRFATIDFGNVINASVSKGTYAIDCDLPNHVGIYSIYTSEEDGVAGN